jgi:hypothetical protein
MLTFFHLSENGIPEQQTWNVWQVKGWMAFRYGAFIALSCNGFHGLQAVQTIAQVANSHVSSKGYV